MLKISDFSKLSQISIRMLRFYDEKDILKPTIIKENGYRFYDSKQLLLAIHINYLKYLGFSIEEMKQILEAYTNREDLVNYLTSHLDSLRSQHLLLGEKIQALTKTIEKMTQEEVMMNYKVEIKEMPEMYMMCKRDIIPSYDKEDQIWMELYKELEMNVMPSKNGLSMAVFYDEGYKDENVDIEIRVAVEGQYEDTNNIKFRKIPAIKVASVIFTGGYEHITEICYHIGQWINEHKYEICGENFSIYHVGYGKTNNPNEFVTEICYPIK